MKKLRIKIFWEAKFTLEDVVVDGHGIFITERINASNHFIEDDAECPPVNWLPMSLVEQNFRGKIFGCAA